MNLLLKDMIVFVGIEFCGVERRNTLRVYIDSNDIANINDCENISKDLNYEPMLDSILWR